MGVELDRGGVGLERDEKSEEMKIECGVKVCEWARIGIGVAEDSEECAGAGMVRGGTYKNCAGGQVPFE